MKPAIQILVFAAPLRHLPVRSALTVGPTCMLCHSGRKKQERACTSTPTARSRRAYKKWLVQAASGEEAWGLQKQEREALS